jgi:16S rRNA (guanine1207-N2)-methyltransferase
MAVDHYFSERPAAASRPLPARLKLPDLDLELITDRGVFAYGQVDRGTHLLLRTIPPPVPGSELLDLGCGYGAVAVALARRCPGCRIWGVDVNERALALCEENTRRAGVDNLRVLPPSQVPEDIRFDAIYSNPPIRVGKERLRALLLGWLQRLKPGGSAYLVVQRALGSDSLAAWMDGNGYRVERMRSHHGYRVLEVHSASATAHDGDHAG